jgi:hypothetical protein
MAKDLLRRLCQIVMNCPTNVEMIDDPIPRDYDQYWPKDSESITIQSWKGNYVTKIFNVAALEW